MLGIFTCQLIIRILHTGLLVTEKYVTHSDTHIFVNQTICYPERQDFCKLCVMYLCFQYISSLVYVVNCVI